MYAMCWRIFWCPCEGETHYITVCGGSLACLPFASNICAKQTCTSLAEHSNSMHSNPPTTMPVLCEWPSSLHSYFPICAQCTGSLAAVPAIPTTTMPTNEIDHIQLRHGYVEYPHEINVVWRNFRAIFNRVPIIGWCNRNVNKRMPKARVIQICVIIKSICVQQLATCLEWPLALHKNGNILKQKLPVYQSISPMLL